jgi:hypothetical protein
LTSFLNFAEGTVEPIFTISPNLGDCWNYLTLSRFNLSLYSALVATSATMLANAPHANLNLVPLLPL